MTAGREDEPPFAHVAIVGLGLIGGSIARDLRARYRSARLTGIDRPGVSSLALERGIVQEVRTSATELSDADLIVLATPVSEILQWIGVLGQAKTQAVVTDVGSTKRLIVSRAQQAGLDQFVGGHPMAGAERSGLDVSREGLFRGRPWFLCPAAGASGASRDRVSRLIEALGAIPTTVSPAAHDRTMAYISHVPQLLASALMATAGDALGKQQLAHAGRAFDEMTRLASSPASMWESVFETNADYIAEAVKAFSGALSPSLATKPAEVRDLFERANRWRADLTSTRGPES